MESCAIIHAFFPMFRPCRLLLFFSFFSFITKPSPKKYLREYLGMGGVLIRWRLATYLVVYKPAPLSCADCHIPRSSLSPARLLYTYYCTSLHVLKKQRGIACLCSDDR